MMSRSPAKLAYYLFIGWWVVCAWIALLWLVMLVPAELPLGLRMINHVPQVLLLNSSPRPRHGRARDAIVLTPASAQVAWPWRLGYALVIGWWLSLLWACLSSLVCASLLGLPLGLMMLSYLPTLAHLQRME